MSPLVSVIVATYRRKNDLQKALISLANQTFDNYEIIVVDDNDSEEWNLFVEKTIKSFQTDNPQINISLIINHPNLGSAKARNEGIKAAKGKYITFLDDDDRYTEDKIKKQVSFMEDLQADFCITNLYLYNENGKLIDKRIRDYIESYSKEALLSFHMKYHMTGTDTMMFKKEYLNKIGGFDAIDVGDEFYLMHKAILAGGKFCYLNTCDIKAFVHSNEAGLSSGTSKINGENQLFEFKKKNRSLISSKDWRYIKSRHHAVLAFAYLRAKKYKQFFIECLQAFFSSPIDSVKIFFKR